MRAGAQGGSGCAGRFLGDKARDFEKEERTKPAAKGNNGEAFGRGDVTVRSSIKELGRERREGLKLHGDGKEGRGGLGVIDAYR